MSFLFIYDFNSIQDIIIYYIFLNDTDTIINRINLYFSFFIITYNISPFYKKKNLIKQLIC